MCRWRGQYEVGCDNVLAAIGLESERLLWACLFSNPTLNLHLIDKSKLVRRSSPCVYQAYKKYPLFNFKNCFNRDLLSWGLLRSPCREEP